MEKIKKILVHEGKTFYWKNKDLHTHFGVIKESELKKKDLRMVKSHSGKKFFALKPNFTDLIKKIKREPQIPLLKDIAIILTYTGINKNSIIVDAGTGCGMLAACLGRIAKKVISYEKNPKFLKLAEKNLQFLGLKNVKLKNKDINLGIEEKKLDLITLDLPEPWEVLKHAEKSLKNGSFLATYLPNITQVNKLVEEAQKHKFIKTKTIEILEREWHIEGKRIRPKTQMIGHTAFLTFMRKV